jgi:alpha-1,6-mannosyltransferase
MLLALRFIHNHQVIAYASLFISSSLLYLFICRDSLRTELPAQGLIPIVLLLLVVRLGFLAMQPIGSDDVYRYMWDGRVQAAGINPYRYAPNDSALTYLHTTNLPALVNHTDLKTLYFPLSEWIFYLGYSLSGEHTWGFQLFILISEVLTIIGLWMLMRDLSYLPSRVLLYAANPLIILQFSLDSHIDALGFPFLIFGLLLYFRKRLAYSLLLIGLSLLIKPAALVILPILFLDQTNIAKRLMTVVIPAVVMFIPFFPYSLGVNPFEALSVFSRNWYFNGALFSLLLPFIPDNLTNRLWCLGILAVILLVLYANRKPVNEKIVLSTLLLLLCSPVAHPWYMGWMIVLLPLAPLASGIALAASASLPSITFVTYQLHGIWKDYPLVLILEYVPVVALLVYDLRRKVNTGSYHSGDDGTERVDP